MTAGTQEDCHAVIPLRYVTESIVPEMPQWSQGAERLSHAPPKAFKKSQYQRRSVPWRTARPAANGCRVREPRSVAKALLTDRSTVTKIETGARPPNDKLLALWLDACGVAGQFRTVLEGLGVLARAKEDSALLKVAPWFETEAKAHTLRYWAPVIVPGLVQTETYARELFAAMAFDDAKVTEFLEVRMGRQAIIDRPEPPDITIVLWEPVLHHQIGSRTVMREQLGHLMDMSHRPAITIHILPSSLGANPGLGGAINLAATDDAPELLLSDGMVEDQLSQDPTVVRKARATFTSVRADALNRSDSRNMLTEAMERWSN